MFLRISYTSIGLVVTTLFLAGSTVFVHRAVAEPLPDPVQAAKEPKAPAAALSEDEFL
jgi:hypothetical protein